MLLVKFNLSFMVVFSAVISYLLAPRVKEYDWISIILLFVWRYAGYGKCECHQSGHGKTYRRNDETYGRQAGCVRKNERCGSHFICRHLRDWRGTMLLWHFNFLTALLSVISLFFYAFIYTPLKKVSSVAVLVGAVPGAMPCLIGWAAGNDSLECRRMDICLRFSSSGSFRISGRLPGLRIKTIRAAGFKLLPSGEGQTKYSALQAVIYSLLLLPVGILPYFNGNERNGEPGDCIASQFFHDRSVCAIIYRE